MGRFRLGSVGWWDRLQVDGMRILPGGVYRTCRALWCGRAGHQDHGNPHHGP